MTLKPLVTTMLLALSCALPAAQAQSVWSYNPYTGGSYWTGAASLLMYPFNRYSSASAPLYLMSPLIRGGAYYANQAVTGNNRRFNYGNYYADDSSADPRQRTRPVVSDGRGVTDQIAHAQRPPSKNQPGPPTGTAMPPTAPGASPGVPANDAPLASGFVELVNEKYQGDVSKALFDPETRSYARSVGLINGDEVFDADLSKQKIATIKAIFADDKEDASTRINAARMLLKH